jgi:quercetin dioxygenase-like cupin family protein
MQVVDLNDIETFPSGPGLDVAFPVHSQTGAAASAIVWMELGPDGVLSEHTDSAEELLYVVRGEVEASVGEESGTLRAGQLAVVPAMAPHSLRNIGGTDARVLGFFAGSTNVTTFTEPRGQDGEQVFVIGAPFRLMARLPEPAVAS